MKIKCLACTLAFVNGGASLSKGSRERRGKPFRRDSRRQPDRI